MEAFVLALTGSLKKKMTKMRVRKGGAEEKSDRNRKSSSLYAESISIDFEGVQD